LVSPELRQLFATCAPTLTEVADAQTPEEKKAIIASLKTMGTPTALEMAQKMVEEMG